MFDRRRATKTHTHASHSAAGWAKSDVSAVAARVVNRPRNAGAGDSAGSPLVAIPSSAGGARLDWACLAGYAFILARRGGSIPVAHPHRGALPVQRLEYLYAKCLLPPYLWMAVADSLDRPPHPLPATGRHRRQHESSSSSAGSGEPDSSTEPRQPLKAHALHLHRPRVFRLASAAENVAEVATRSCPSAGLWALSYYARGRATHAARQCTKAGVECMFFDHGRDQLLPRRCATAAGHASCH